MSGKTNGTNIRHETKADKKGLPPSTVVADPGTSKRNILRKGGKGHTRKEQAAGSQLDDGSTFDDPSNMDVNDPNYDPDEQYLNESYIPSDSTLEIGKAKMKLSAYKKLVEPLIKEYFVSGDVSEVINSLLEIDVKEYSYEFVKRAINMSFDKGDRERELVSQMLSQGYPNAFSTNTVGKGFERLFELVDEIEKDAPSAREMLAKFLARAVVDEVLPPSFLADAVISNLGGEVVEHAKRMLSRDHGGVLLERGWGPGDGRPVEELKVVVDQLALEYLLSGDQEEATRCLRELSAPQFMHEVVKRVIVLSLDKVPDKQHQVSALFKHWVALGLLSPAQAAKGFDKVHHIIGDLALDTPAAASLVDGFLGRARADKVVPADYKPGSVL